MTSSHKKKKKIITLQLPNRLISNELIKTTRANYCFNNGNTLFIVYKNFIKYFLSLIVRRLE